MYREQLIPFCHSGTPRLLDKDELAMENQQGAEGPDAQEQEHEAGGKNKNMEKVNWNVLKISKLYLLWIVVCLRFILTKQKLQKSYVYSTLSTTFLFVTGHGDIFSCCQNDNLRGLPVSFFMIHILGGMVLFMTDGIVVSAEKNLFL